MRRPASKNSNPVVRLVCAILFIVFTFVWLFWFQADVLAVAQHGLSGGATHYNRTVGAVICTAVLFGVQLLVCAFVRTPIRAHALTWLPSMLLLAFVSSVSSPFRWGAWLWAAPLVLLLWGGVVWLSRQLMPFGESVRNHDRPLLFSRQMWINLLQMAAMMLGVAAVSNTNAVFHFKAHAEVALMEGNADEALRVGNESLETDESLTMLRIFALSQKGLLADHLFEYVVDGTSNDMLPLGNSKGRLLLMPDSLLWHHFGAKPDSVVSSVRQYLDSLDNDTLATRARIDYRLMGQLIDRRLDTFVVCLPHHYVMEADSLPRHYREALIIYQQKIDTLFIYRDSIMLQRWNEFVSYDSIYPKRSERLVRTEDLFHGSYWYYYFQEE